jgi:3-hydroxybutyryl-CoA dehydratase
MATTLAVGDRASFTKTITESDIILYAGITGDMNPVHIDETFAKKSLFKQRIAHGMLSAGLISTVLGTRIPGPGAIYLSQRLEFRKPVFIGDTITATVEVTAVEVDNPKKQRVTLSTTCTNQDGAAVLTGEAMLIPPHTSD